MWSFIILCYVTPYSLVMLLYRQILYLYCAWDYWGSDISGVSADLKCSSEKVIGCECIIAICLDGRQKKEVDKAVRWEVVTEMIVTGARFWHVTPWGHSYTVMLKAAGFSKRAVPFYHTVRHANSSSVDATGSYIYSVRKLFESNE